MDGRASVSRGKQQLGVVGGGGMQEELGQGDLMKGPGAKTWATTYLQKGTITHKWVNNKYYRANFHWALQKRQKRGAPTLGRSIPYRR